MTSTPSLTALNRFIYDLMWFVPLVCVGIPLFIWCVYWLCFGRRKPQVDEIASNDLVIHMYVGPCLSESDIAEIESEHVKDTPSEPWSL